MTKTTTRARAPRNRFAYTTRLVWTKDKQQVVAFYGVTLPSGQRLGVVPAGIDVTYRNKHYTTMGLLESLRGAHSITFNVSDKLKPQDWYDMRSGDKFQLAKFVKLCRIVQRPATLSSTAQDTTNTSNSLR